MNLGSVRKRAAVLGAWIDETELSWDVWAPDGHVWRSSGDRVLTVNFSNGWGETWKREAATDAMQRMAAGLEAAA